mmetsp:Transcript_30951/g.69899  ORF Transcript_30951/g.69899 Transcript_30951/m.69899 type:complete len:161 (-) Transcript_30951:5-487(-)
MVPIVRPLMNPISGSDATSARSYVKVCEMRTCVARAGTGGDSGQVCGLSCGRVMTCSGVDSSCPVGCSLMLGRLALLREGLACLLSGSAHCGNGKRILRDLNDCESGFRWNFVRWFHVGQGGVHPRLFVGMHARHIKQAKVYVVLPASCAATLSSAEEVH